MTYNHSSAVVGHAPHILKIVDVYTVGTCLLPYLDTEKI